MVFASLALIEAKVCGALLREDMCGVKRSIGSLVVCTRQILPDSVDIDLSAHENRFIVEHQFQF